MPLLVVCSTGFGQGLFLEALRLWHDPQPQVVVVKEYSMQAQELAARGLQALAAASSPFLTLLSASTFPPARPSYSR